MQMWTCNQTPAQQWQFWSDDTLRPASNPSFCLDAKTGVPSGGSGGAAVYSLLQLYACAGNDRQLWSMNTPSTSMTTGTVIYNNRPGPPYLATLYIMGYTSGTPVQSANAFFVAGQSWVLNLTPAPTQTTINAAFCASTTPSCANQPVDTATCSPGQSLAYCCPTTGPSFGNCGCLDNTGQPATQQCIVSITYAWTHPFWGSCTGPCGAGAGTQTGTTPWCQGHIDNGAVTEYGSAVDASNCGGIGTMPATTRSCTVALCPSTVVSSSTGIDPAGVAGATAGGASTHSSASSSSGLSMPATVGIVAGVIFTSILLAVVAFALYRRHQQSKQALQNIHMVSKGAVDSTSININMSEK